MVTIYAQGGETVRLILQSYCLILQKHLGIVHNAKSLRPSPCLCSESSWRVKLKSEKD